MHSTPSNGKKVATEYYNFVGVKIAHPVKGNTYIIKTTFESGKTNVVLYATALRATFETASLK